MIPFLALAGVVGISFSAIFVRLAAVSPVTAAFYRAAYAVPVLAVIVAVTHRQDRRSRRARLLAFASGLLLAADLALWHVSIAMIGAGLATVIANVQVVFVALVAWALYAERPSPRTLLVVAIVLGGLMLTSGLARPDAYGASPVLGVVFGALAGACYAGFLLTFRAANRSLAPTAGPLLESTLGTVAGALLVAPFDAGFAFAPHVPAHLWLLALAIVSQVIGWLLIATALPRLRAVETSILLMAQPVITLVWGVLLFRERLSALQWIGTALVVGGVAAVGRRPATRAGAAFIAPAPGPTRGAADEGRGRPRSGPTEVGPC
jgi:drug/metabolite transporter (DMT)-like permease